jgi:hypothetical protein
MEFEATVVCQSCGRTVISGSPCRQCFGEAPAYRAPWWLWVIAIVFAVIGFAIIDGPREQRNVDIASCQRTMQASGFSGDRCDSLVDQEHATQ